VGKLDVAMLAIYPSISRDRPVAETEQYHRRDLTVLPLRAPDGSARIAALGGVFVPGQMAGFLHPVYVETSSAAPGFTLEVDEGTTQWLSQYEVAAVPIYSASEHAMYVTLFGGISQYYYKDGKLQHDAPNFNISPAVDGLPFIDSVSTLKVTAADSAQFVHDADVFPPRGTPLTCGTGALPAPYLGAETVFVPRADAVGDLGVIELDQVTAPIIVGYLVGGIASTAPYPNGDTCASSTYFQVTLVPGQPTATTRVTL